MAANTSTPDSCARRTDFLPFRRPQPLDQPCIGSGELEITEFLARDPSQILHMDRLRLTRDKAASEKKKPHRFFWIRMSQILDKLAN